MDALERALGAVAGFVWGPPMLILLFGTHLYLTGRLRFVQRYVGLGIRLSLRRAPEGKGDVSQFGALTTALAATIGTGNIVGVATAVAAGGPGAGLWMWLTGVFGIATKYAEAVLSVKYRVRTAAGTMAGGPMYVLERAMNARGLATFFAIVTTITALGAGNMVQANSIATLLESGYGVSPWISGGVLTLVTGVVLIGGIRSIAAVCEKLIPFMASWYVTGCLLLLVIGWRTIPDSLALIVGSAFSGQAALGGFLGASVMQAMRFGIARGLFSNESGLGSAAIVAAAASTPNPVRQGLVASTGTFWDTVVVCALTGLVLVNSGAWTQGLNGAAMTNAAFETLPVVGPILLAVGLLTFVFSTILGWSYYGERAIEYLGGPRVIPVYRWVWVGAVMVGSVMSLQVVWNFADIANALMAIPNLISLLWLSRTLVDETRDYLWRDRLDQHVEPSGLATEPA